MLLGIPRSARCIQRFNDSLNSAIHITYHISLHSSSIRELHFHAASLTSGLATDDPSNETTIGAQVDEYSIMILLQVHLQKPCYNFYFL
ncbi:Putative uncharacterized protein ART3 [Leucoagaricus sp. SymC.cos]|nr:Putative uncharacterized protein ART3 [Leucoagaricus sp. SymC.cos]